MACPCRASREWGIGGQACVGIRRADSCRIRFGVGSSGSRPGQQGLDETGGEVLLSKSWVSQGTPTVDYSNPA